MNIIQIRNISAALLFTAFVFVLGSQAFAREEGGFTGPGPALVTVLQALDLQDNTHVTLQGNIVQRLGNDTYLFKDNTGAIHVEIEDDNWKGQNIGPDDLVELSGKIDKNRNSTEMDVKRIIKKQ